jgi:acetyltransferase-like isoleucine patch superfamily enzyme/SAM-dependent methyltransferase
MKFQWLRQTLARQFYRLLPIPVPPAETHVRGDVTEELRRRGVRIGQNTHVFGWIDGINPHLVQIGNHCFLGANSALLTDCPIRGPRPIKIGDYVWIGFNALILPGVEIGSACVIGAGAVVTKDIPERSVVAGNPARVLRQLTDEEANSLQDRLRSGQPIGKDEQPGACRHELVGQARLWKMKRDFQIAFLKQAGLQPGHQLLDLGCGTLRGGIPIIAYLDAEHYHGIDSRAQVLEEARKELADAKLQDKHPQLVHCDDLRALTLPTQFDIIWAFSVLFHMSDEILDGAMAFIGRQLKPTGAFYANVNIGVAPPSHWREFPVHWRTREAYQQLAARYGMRIEDLGSFKELGHCSGDEDNDAQVMLRFTKG